MTALLDRLREATRVSDDPALVIVLRDPCAVGR